MKSWIRTLLIVSVLFALVATFYPSITSAAGDSTTRTEQVAFTVNNCLMISSNRQSLQTVEVRGNMTAAKITSPKTYPADNFNFTVTTPGHYTITLSFNYSSDYNVTITTTGDPSSSSSANPSTPIGVIRSVVTTHIPQYISHATYYVSSGPLLLTIELDVNALTVPAEVVNRTPWEDFLNWLARFGAAFPTWVKLIYLVLGLQFTLVGYTWIGFENRTREKNVPGSAFDFGNKVYLWSEVAQKFFLTTFLIIIVLMGGQFIGLSMLNVMFLLPVNMLSLWDLFVLCFAGGMVIIAYITKLILRKTLDWEPTFEEN